MSKKKYTDVYMGVASALGLRYDAENNVLHGQRDGYDIILYPQEPSDQPYMLTVHTAAKSADGSYLSKDRLKELQKASKLTGCAHKGNVITGRISGGIGRRGSQQSLTESTAAGLAGLTAFLRQNGFTPCCSICGKEEMVSAYQAEGIYHHLCGDCETSMRQKYATMKPKKENVVGGIVGAVLGSLLGVLCIVLLSQLGYVAALSGVVMAIGVLKGYELLGGRLTKKGIVICVVVMLLMTYLGDRLDWALLLYREGGGAEAGFNVFECYRLVPWAISEQMIGMTAYIGNMLFLYLFVLLGAVPTIRSRVREKQQEGIMAKLM
ncbi:MAG: FUSC family protein [Eubacterium sp.]|nr:FUSC family protein [Eubacterium sp.]MCM1214251.1 FUSC family protein [Lachnospiraceae bacterium]MCM1302597.1 FUSC family protein [Butyrivibrio sp.]MCM1342274.1 FUSC family protein [Muribaculaceae bacterium]MCM1238089.1 FUSC family protein [Lachnospiraceae bacterium]